MCFGISGQEKQTVFDCLKTINAVWPSLYNLPVAAQSFFDICLVNCFKNYTLFIEFVGAADYSQIEVGIRNINASHFSLGNDIVLLNGITGPGKYYINFGVDRQQATEIMDKIRPFVNNAGLVGGIQIQTMHILAFRD
jgi:hypothetical protein